MRKCQSSEQLIKKILDRRLEERKLQVRRDIDNERLRFLMSERLVLREKQRAV